MVNLSKPNYKMYFCLTCQRWFKADKERAPGGGLSLCPLCGARFKASFVGTLEYYGWLARRNLLWVSFLVLLGSIVFTALGFAVGNIVVGVFFFILLFLSGAVFLAFVFVQEGWVRRSG